MTDFLTRYNKLNSAQQQAVDTIDGPLLVIAGPGTGKTELLSMRAANILRKTDTSPDNILCLTFTDSGANAMRERLGSIIGPDAYKVAIHTFHSFGTEVINQHREYFFSGASFKPADDLASHEILTGIFDELPHDNPLASKLNGEYTYLKDAKKTISELKRAGLTSDELLNVINQNDAVLDSVEKELSSIFAGKISVTMLASLVPVAEKVAALPAATLPAGVTPMQNVLSLSMAHAFDTAVASNKTTPITAWRNQWMEKDHQGNYVFKDRKRHAKLRSIAHIYFSYSTQMEQAMLFDYDDMILNVIHAMELRPELLFNLQEKYHYIMVDEFQDTNLAQLRLLFNLTNNPASEGSPNVMAVGDDDQAIYSFQGADVNNIHKFRDQYGQVALVVLTDNYRSAKPIITHAREVITQGTDRLESTIKQLDKTLTAHSKAAASVQLIECDSVENELQWVAADINTRIKTGTHPASIAVLARRHNELVQLLPYAAHHNIAVNYERRDNVLDMPVIHTIELLARVAVELFDGHHDHADDLLPELVCHPAFGFAPHDIWQLSLASYRNRKTWVETMLTMPVFKPLAEWLQALSSKVMELPMEPFIDELLGTPTDLQAAKEPVYISPLYNYYFSPQALQTQPDAYLRALEGLKTIRAGLREYRQTDFSYIPDFLEYIHLHQDMNAAITSVRPGSDSNGNAIHLMTAHKSKGLEFDVVYIIGSIDSNWGERARGKSSLIGYPQNLPLAPAGNTYNERLRLYFVAMTRAKQHLLMSYSTTDSKNKSALAAGFLAGTTLTPTHTSPADDITTLTSHAELSWHGVVAALPQADMQTLLAPTLENYKLSATHLNNFLDVTRGGPQSFMIKNLLRFPQSQPASARYGTAIHATLQKAHNYLAANKAQRPIEDMLGDFNAELSNQYLTNDEYEHYSKRGADSLQVFLDHAYNTFTPAQKTELSFAGQGAIVGGARLTGSMDLVDIDQTAKTIAVTDYKTGKPASSWQGTQDYQKIKLHRYKQQLMFYQLLVQHSRDYATYTYTGGTLQFVEPDIHKQIHSLLAAYMPEDLERFTTLIAAVWQKIMALDFPDVTNYEQNYKGILAFEDDLIDNFIKQ